MKLQIDDIPKENRVYFKEGYIISSVKYTLKNNAWQDNDFLLYYII